MCPIMGDFLWPPRQHKNQKIDVILRKIDDMEIVRHNVEIILEIAIWQCDVMICVCL